MSDTMDTGGEQSVPMDNGEVSRFGLTPDQLQALATQQLDSPKWPYTPPPREIFRDGSWEQYDGHGNVNERGQFIRFDENGDPSYYDLDNDPIQMYYGLPPDELSQIVDVLDRKGYSVNTIPQVQSALANIMLQANVEGRDFNYMLRQLDRRAPDKQPAAPRYRVTSAADIRSVAHEMAKRTLGRRFTEDEVNKFVESYQSSQVAAQQAGAGVAEQATSLQTAAEQYAMQAAPTEAQGYKFLGKMDTFMGLLGGRF